MKLEIGYVDRPPLEIASPALFLLCVMTNKELENLPCKELEITCKEWIPIIMEFSIDRNRHTIVRSSAPVSYQFAH